VQLLWEQVGRRDSQESEEAVQLVRLLRDEVGVPAQDLTRLLERPEHRTGDDGADRTQPERERPRLQPRD
jgi:hypothetical protein